MDPKVPAEILPLPTFLPLLLQAALRGMSAKTTSVVMFLVAAAMVSAWLITVAQLPQQVISWLEPLLGKHKPGVLVP